MPQEDGVLVIHCSDPRYQIAFQDFLRNKLGLDHYALIAVPGGPQFLTLAEYLPKFSWAGWRWVKFLGNLGNSRRVILIAHDDCRWYQDMGFVPAAGSTREKQAEDLHRVCAGIRERFGNPRIELYYARLDRDRAAFEIL